MALCLLTCGFLGQSGHCAAGGNGRRVEIEGQRFSLKQACSGTPWPSFGKSLVRASSAEKRCRGSREEGGIDLGAWLFVFEAALLLRSPDILETCLLQCFLFAAA